MEDITRSWDRRPDEPEVWYRIFRDYFLPLGDRRSLRNAFEFFVRVETPKQYRELDPENITRTPSHWNQIALDWEWAKRALEYDESKMPDFASAYVQQVLTYLQTNALNAAHGLVQALNNDRTRVQAANSILNRIGVPETSNINLAMGVTFTSDELAAAANRIEEWKTKKQSGLLAEEASPTS